VHSKCRLKTEDEDEFQAEAIWNFFETAHGKGPVDGISAEVKKASLEINPSRKSSGQ